LGGSTSQGINTNISFSVDCPAVIAQASHWPSAAPAALSQSLLTVQGAGVQPARSGIRDWRVTSVTSGLSSFVSPLLKRTPYHRVFAGKIEFECEGTFCVFPRFAQRRRSGSDAGLLDQLFNLARDHYGAASAHEDWTSRVRTALRSQLAPRLVEQVSLASQLGLSSRALSRRLSREGSSVSQLVDEVLFERARASLRRPGSTAAKVAEELGYAELSSFFRAFRRWSGGVTPRAYREREGA